MDAQPKDAHLQFLHSFVSHYHLSQHLFDHREMEQEIETVLVLAKKLKLRTVGGQLVAGFMKVFECENPYVIVILIDSEYGHSLRVDIHKEDLAYELRQWLEGKQIRNPAVLIPVRIEDAINRFVKFGKTPLQEDLIMWMLSRSELYLGDAPELTFGGKEATAFGSGTATGEAKTEYDNEYSRTAMAAVRNDQLSGQLYRIEDAVGRGTKLEFSLPSNNRTTTHLYKANPAAKVDNQDLGMFSMTRKLLGKSATLEMLKKSRVKGREGARQTVASSTWNSEHLALVAGVEKARKNIEQAMDERRKMIEVAKVRQLQAADKFRKIRETLAGSAGAGKFVTAATHELLSLQKMEYDIMEDIKRQRNRAQRTAQNVTWTMAPSGFVNRRGKSQRGPVLGPGPLHPNATSALKDPRVEQTVRKYYWDSAGRRHLRDGHDDSGNESLVEKALEAIRRAAANISAFKLDLKAVFEEFDTSGDGFLSPPEMAQAFLSMGVQLDVESMTAIFKHFDPNDSGTVHFGEFVWAFFNRRGLVRQWKRKTEGMTEATIKTKFHLADVNGDGRLNPKEFKKLLKSFGMEMAAADIEILIDRFDLDNDGDIDLHEFRAFIESEQKNLFETENAGANKSKALPPPKSQLYKGGTSDDLGVSQPRPQTAGIADRQGSSSAGHSARRQSSAPRGRGPVGHNSAGNSTNSSAHPSRSPSPAASRQRTHPLSKSVSIQSPKDREPALNKHRTYPRPSDPSSRLQVREEDLENTDQSEASEHPSATRGETVNSRGAGSSSLWRMDAAGAAVSDMPRLGPSASLLDGDQGPQGRDPLDEVPDEDVDVLWVSRMLQAQAEIEARIGKRYY